VAKLSEFGLWVFSGLYASIQKQSKVAVLLQEGFIALPDAKGNVRLIFLMCLNSEVSVALNNNEEWDVTKVDYDKWG